MNFSVKLAFKDKFSSDNFACHKRRITSYCYKKRNQTRFHQNIVYEGFRLT